MNANLLVFLPLSYELTEMICLILHPIPPPFGYLQFLIVPYSFCPITPTAVFWHSVGISTNLCACRSLLIRSNQTQD